MSTHVITLKLVVETNDGADLDDVIDDFRDSLTDQIVGIEETFCTYVANPDYDDMALSTEPTAEEASEGYYLAEGDELEDEIEVDVTWEITDLHYVSHRYIPTHDEKLQLINGTTAALAYDARQESK